MERVNTDVIRQLRDTYTAWLQVPFPELGKDIDGYPEYNSELAGLITRVTRRDRPAISELPELQASARQTVSDLLTGDGPEVDDLRRNEATVRALLSLLQLALRPESN